MKKIATILLIATCAIATVNAETTVQGTAPYPCNSNVTIQATPANQYIYFTGWTDDEATNTIVSSENPFTFPATADVTYTALFKRKTFTVTYTLNPNAADNKGVTLANPDADNQNVTTVTVTEGAGLDYTFDATKYSGTDGNCVSITGFVVTMYELQSDGTVATTETTIRRTDLTDPNNLKFPLNGNATITPIVTQGSYTVTIKSDTSMGTVSFVTNTTENP